MMAFPRNDDGPPVNTKGAGRNIAGQRCSSYNNRGDSTVSAAVDTTTRAGFQSLPDASASLMDWALYWASLGIRVFPLGDRRTPGTLAPGQRDFSKMPKGKCADCKTSGKTGARCLADCDHLGCHGSLGATTDPEQIRAWWTARPNANIGGATGRESGILVIEADVAHEFKDGDTTRIVDGRDVLTATIEENGGNWPTTWTNLSGSDGPHYLFRHPERLRKDGSDWGNTVGGTAEAKVCEAVDGRGRGGYIVLPPSSSNKGHYRIDTIAEFADVPEWVLGRIDKAPAAVRPARKASSVRPHVSTGDAVQDTARRLFNASIDILRNTTSGRNGALNTAAYAVAGLVWHTDSGITEQEARNALWEATTSNGYVAKDGEHAAQESLTSGWDSGWAKPYSPWPPEDRPFTPTRQMLTEDAVVRLVEIYGDMGDLDTIAMYRDDVPDTLWNRHVAPLFKEASISEPQRRPAPAPSKPKLTVVTDNAPALARPVIVTKDRPMRDVRTDMYDALRDAHQDDPKLFAHGTDVVIASGGRLATLGPNTMAVEFSEVADFVVPSSESASERKKVRKANAKKIADGKELDDMPEQEWTHVDPPMVLVKSALETPGELGLPEVDRVMTIPFFGPDGALQAQAGYHRQARTIHIPGVVVPEIPAAPTQEDVDGALALILDEMLGQFPFVTQADAAAALALGLTVVVRPMIDGPAPLFLVNAPTAGTGKGLLMEAILRPLSGRSYTVTSAPTALDEWHKSIVATLRTGPVAAIFDNVNSDLDSGPLASSVTAWPLIAPRVLGASEIVELPPPCAFVATGNNVTASAENARRIVQIRLDAKSEKPHERTGWRHPDLRAWFTANTGRIVAAWLTLAQSWVTAGMPEATVPAMGSFEAWSKVVGSILAHLGVDGFLENRSGLAKAIDTESAARDLFTWGWINDPGGYHYAVTDGPEGISPGGRESCAGREVTSSDLLKMIVANGYDFPCDLGSGGERSQVTKFGGWLRKLVGQRVGEGGQYTVTSRVVRGQTVYGLESNS
jgi:hypothetical protein